MLNIFLVSSPLQAIVVDSLVNDDDRLLPSNTRIFVEGDLLLINTKGIPLVQVACTRLNNSKAIKDNLSIIAAYDIPMCNLWISDILWPLNNAIYTYLIESGKLKAVNFFDEGFVLYWMQKLSNYRYIREMVKFFALRFKTGIHFTAPSNHPFYGNKKNGLVFAFHPALLSNQTKVRQLTIDSNIIKSLGLSIFNDARYKSQLADLRFNKCSIVLSQPYYRVSSDIEYIDIMNQMANYIRLNLSDCIYIKLHPSEDLNIYEKFYKPLGFKLCFEDVKMPIEILLHYFGSDTSLISINSSALLNARKFGYRGKVISYGIDRVERMYMFQQSEIANQRNLLKQLGVNVIVEVNDKLLRT